METKTVALLLSFILAVQSSSLTYNEKIIDFVLDIKKSSSYSGLVIIVDEDIFAANEELVEELIVRYQRPVTLLLREQLKKLHDDVEKEIVVNDFIILVQNLHNFISTYNLITFRYNVGHVVVATKSSREEARKLLMEIRSETLFLLTERRQHFIIQRWGISDRIYESFDNIGKEIPIYSRRKLNGRHLKIATLDFPPIVFANKKSGQLDVFGIEPSLMDVMAERLDFKFSYMLPPPDEMWGTLIFTGDNVTVTGLLGLLDRKIADVAYGDLHMQQRLLPYVDFTQAFRNNYECFLVPAPRPYAKWTALYHPFSPEIWAVTGFAFVLATVTLRLLAAFVYQLPNKDYFFSDFMVSFLYILGSMLGVQQPQEIRRMANRWFLTWWLLAAATIIPTLYRSGLISFITFPYTPPPIDTIKQLADSSLQKISWGEYYKTSLLNSTDSLHRYLGGQLVVATNIEDMFSLVETNFWAVMSNQGNLLYEVASRFPPTSNGPRFHLVHECVFPTRSAIGLQKRSPLKPYFDREISKIAEAGIVEHITALYAKKQDNWNPRANAGKLFSYSLDSLQGAFYVWLLGLGLSTLTFIAELVFHRYHQKWRKLNTSRK